jgi:hypothetical protein
MSLIDNERLKIQPKDNANMNARSNGSAPGLKP